MLIFSLTTIPPRFPHIHLTLKSLLRQKRPADKIIVNIPKTYRRFPVNKCELSSLPKGVEINMINFDYGPATKILPTIRKFRDTDATIIFCDDDRTYDRNWSQRFVDCAAQIPNTCITEVGWSVEDLTGQICRPQPRMQAARIHPKPQNGKEKFLRELRRLYTRKSRIFSKSGYVDIFGGCGGVLVKSDFFNDIAFDIPEILWTVDDVWLSGCLAQNQIDIWANADGREPVRNKANDLEELFLFSVNGIGRHDANRTAVNYFRERHSIWL